MAKSDEKQTVKVTETLRAGWLAYLGIYGAAFERIQPRFEKLNASTGDIFSELVAKGEALEATAQETIEDVRVRAEETYGTRMTKIRSLFPVAGNDNTDVAELQAEIEALNKQVTSLKRKVTSIDKAVKAA